MGRNSTKQLLEQQSYLNTSTTVAGIRDSEESIFTTEYKLYVFKRKVPS